MNKFDYDAEERLARGNGFWKLVEPWAAEVTRLRGVVASQLESIQNLGTAPHCPTCACRADQPDAVQCPHPTGATWPADDGGWRCADCGHTEGAAQPSAPRCPFCGVISDWMHSPNCPEYKREVCGYTGPLVPNEFGKPACPECGAIPRATDPTADPLNPAD